jgi:hypothetical protein
LIGDGLQTVTTTGNKHHWHSRFTQHVRHLFADAA